MRLMALKRSLRPKAMVRPKAKLQLMAMIRPNSSINLQK
jgi:hypothetical protein